MSIATIRIEGVDEILAKLDPAILGPIVVDGFTEIAVIAKAEIERRTPVFRGVLARSIVMNMDEDHAIPEFVKIGRTGNPLLDKFAIRIQVREV